MEFKQLRSQIDISSKKFQLVQEHASKVGIYFNIYFSFSSAMGWALFPIIFIHIYTQPKYILKVRQALKIIKNSYFLVRKDSFNSSVSLQNNMFAFSIQSLCTVSLQDVGNYSLPLKFTIHCRSQKSFSFFYPLLSLFSPPFTQDLQAYYIVVYL